MDKIKAAKEQGNAAFKQKNFKDAITCYEEALMQTKFRKSDMAKADAELTEEEKEIVKAQNAEIDTIHQALLNNLAMCFQKKNQMNESCFYNDQCLELNPGHIKARYRKAVLLAHEKDFEEAFNVARELLAEDPTSTEFTDLLRQVQQKQETHEAELRQAMDYANSEGNAAANQNDIKPSKGKRETPYVEGPLKEVLNKRGEKTRQEVFDNIKN